MGIGIYTSKIGGAEREPSVLSFCYSNTHMIFIAANVEMTVDEQHQSPPARCLECLYIRVMMNGGSNEMQ